MYGVTAFPIDMLTSISKLRFYHLMVWADCCFTGTLIGSPDKKSKMLLKNMVISWSGYGLTFINRIWEECDMLPRS